MTNFITLLKINLLSFLGINKLKYSRNIKEHKNLSSKLILFFIVLAMVAYYMYHFAEATIDSFILMGKHEYFLLVFMFLASSYILIFNIYKGPSTIFGFKDYDILASLPVSRKEVILSKFIGLYLTNLLYQALIMLPAFGVYLSKISVSEVFVIVYLLSFLVIGLIPVIISTLLGTVINYIASKFSHKNIISILSSLLLMSLMMFLNYKLSSSSMGNLVINEVKFITKFKYIYPIIVLYLKMLQNSSTICMLLIYAISLLALYLFIWVIDKYYLKINSMLLSVRKKIYKYKELKQNSVLKSLLKKESTKYFKTPLYFLNTSTGVILLLVFAIGISIFYKESYSTFTPIINKYLPFVISILCAMSCTTHCSMSLEGKNYWMYQVFPVNMKKVIYSKVFFNLLICCPILVAVNILFIITFELSLATKIFIFVIPMLVTFLIAIFGMVLDVMFLTLEWDSEVAIIKQRIPSLIAMFGGLLIAMFPILIDYGVKNWQFSFVVSIIYCVAIIVLKIILDKLIHYRLET